MLKPWLLVLSVCCCHWLKAQNTETDSLLKLLKTAQEDTNKVHLYWKTGASIVYQDPREALTYFKKGAALATQLNFISGTERCLNATSFAFALNAKYDSALVYINYALPYAIKAGDIKRLSLAYLNRADTYYNLTNYSLALKDCDTSIYYAEKMPNNADAFGRIYGVIAYVYMDQQQFELAGINFDKSLQYFQKANNRRMIAQKYSDKADLYNQMKQPTKSLPLLYEAIRIGDSLQDLENLSSYYLSLTETLIHLKRYDDGRSAAMKAIGISSQTGNTLQEGNVYQMLYQIEKEKKNYAGAVSNALKSYNIFQREKDTFRLQVAASDLAEGYLNINNTVEGYKYLKISKDLGDSLQRKQFDQETAKLQTSFEVKAKDREILLLNKEKELQNQKLLKQRLMLFGAATITLLSLAALWLLLNRNKLRQRMKELELRNQIAADLHDEVGSSLSSIHMLSQMATQKTNEGAQQDILLRMSSNARETMDKMGDIVWMIKPGETESASLKQRMERFAYEIGTSKNMEICVQLDELEKQKLTMAQRKNIYLVFKEALNNAAKYSGTNKIDIVSSLNNKELQLVIKDQGKGFDKNIALKGNGLDNMLSRAKEMGGALDIGSSPGMGTIVTLRLPM